MLLGLNVALELVLGNAVLCCMYVPKLSYNLLSVSKATEAGKIVEFHSTDC